MSESTFSAVTNAEIWTVLLVGGPADGRWFTRPALDYMIVVDLELAWSGS